MNNPEIEEVEKSYTQFSKKIVVFFMLNLVAIELFSMVASIYLKSQEIALTMITSLAITTLGSVVWYLKNSESEKKEKIRASVEKLRINTNDNREKEYLDGVIQDLTDSIENIQGDINGINIDISELNSEEECEEEDES